MAGGYVTFLSEALALIGLAAWVLDEDGNLIAANALTRNYADFVRVQQHRPINLTDAAADKRLRAVLTGEKSQSSLARSFPIKPSDGRSINVLHFIPVPCSAREIFVGCSAVLIMTSITAPSPPIELVQSLYGFTPAETRVARSLASGSSVDDICSCSGVSRNTVRTHLRRVLEKTGCNRQSEAVALLAGIPVLPSIHAQPA